MARRLLVPLVLALTVIAVAVFAGTRGPDDSDRPNRDRAGEQIDEEREARIEEAPKSSRNSRKRPRSGSKHFARRRRTGRSADANESSSPPRPAGPASS
jgi:hypothetical protein